MIAAWTRGGWGERMARQCAGRRHAAKLGARRGCAATAFLYVNGVRPLLTLICVFLLAGCSSFDAHIEPEASLSTAEHFWVERNLSDNHGMGAKIVRGLQAHGRQAELGPLTMMPNDAGLVLLSFSDHWSWDFGDHITGLQITARDARSKRLLARARFEGPLAMHLDEFEVIDRVLTDLLAERKTED